MTQGYVAILIDLAFKAYNESFIYTEMFNTMYLNSV